MRSASIFALSRRRFFKATYLKSNTNSDSIDDRPLNCPYVIRTIPSLIYSPPAEMGLQFDPEKRAGKIC